MIIDRVLILILGLCLSQFGMATVSVMIKPQPAYVGQELNLIIQQQGANVSQIPPDISSLAADFEILGQQQSMAYQMYNGAAEHINTWTFVVLPKHPGKFTLPSLRLGTESTNMQIIEVRPQHHTSVNQQAPATGVFMEWRLEPEQAVVHQQVKVKIEIYHAMPLMDANLSSPQVENALLFSMDATKHQQVIRDGQRYELESYEYLLFPQKAGTLAIKSPRLDALEYNFALHPVHIRLPNKNIEVGAAPAAPAQKLKYEFLKTKHHITKLTEGDTYTRELLLEAHGLPYQMLPDLKPNCGKACKVYVQNLRNKNLIKNGNVVGIKRLSISYLPTAAGTMEIKDMEIPWFNTQTQRLELLKIPGTKLQVMDKVMPVPNLGINQVEPKLMRSFHLPSVVWGVLGLIAGALGMQLYRRISWQQFFRWVKPKKTFSSRIQQACCNNDPHQLRIELLAWGRKKYSMQIRELDALAKLVEGEFKIEIEQLIEQVYGQKSTKNHWDGKKFWSVFKRFCQGKKIKMRKKNPPNRLNPC